MTVELWLYPDALPTLELSTKCRPPQAFRVAAETRRFLGKHGIDLSEEQECAGSCCQPRRGAARSGRRQQSAGTAGHRGRLPILALAELVIARGDEMDARHHDVEQPCITLLALQAPVATDLRTVVATLHALGGLQRMGNLVQHTAKIARHTHPNLTVPDDLRPVIARMSLLACGLAQHAATAIEKLDPLSGDRLARATDEIDALFHQLLRTLFAESRSHGVEPAVHAALVGRYYERFADHAVAIAGQVCYLTTGRVRSHFYPLRNPPTRGTDSNIRTPARVAIQLGVRAGGSQGPVVKSCWRAWSLSMPHLVAVSR